MSKQFVVATTCLSLIIFFFDGCRKLDYHDPAKRCKIVETDARIITYDEWGNPVKAEFKVDPDATGNPTWHFEYNDKHQLVGYHGFNDHNLTLNANGQAILDTMIMNYGGQDDRFARRISYDLYGRIVRIISQHYHSGMEDLQQPFVSDTSYFRYDKRGNKVIEGVDEHGTPIALPYDFKTSVYRTHPVFMFVHNDYSRNNLVPSWEPYDYNDAGLPINFQGTFLEASGAIDHFIYDCAESLK
jgi:hypothetical protein